MARTQANIYLTIWADPDFRRLSTDAQWLYFTMLTHESLNYCGVMDWRPARLAGLNETMTIPRLEHAAWELGQNRLIAVDPNTEEALVRSFVRHDGVLKQPNPTKGLVREFGGIASLLLMELVAIEVRRALEENPDWKGAPFAEPVTKQFSEPTSNPSEWVPSWFQKGSGQVPDLIPPKTPNPSEEVPLPLTSTSTSTSTDVERAAKAATQPKQTHGTRIDPNYQPDPRSIEIIRKDFPSYDTKAEHPNFVDYWLGVSGAKGVKRDWEATWRKWMRTNAQRAQGDHRRRGPVTTDRMLNAIQIGEQLQAEADAAAAQAQRELTA